jgi:hypothetical protein
MGGAHFCEAELRLRFQLRVPFCFLAAGRGFLYARTEPRKKMSSAALFRIFFWPRLEPLGWIFFESRRAAGAKNRLPQAVRSPL